MDRGSGKLVIKGIRDDVWQIHGDVEGVLQKYEKGGRVNGDRDRKIKRIRYLLLCGFRASLSPKYFRVLNHRVFCRMGKRKRVYDECRAGVEQSRKFKTLLKEAARDAGPRRPAASQMIAHWRRLGFVI